MKNLLKLYRLKYRFADEVSHWAAACTGEPAIDTIGSITVKGASIKHDASIDDLVTADGQHCSATDCRLSIIQNIDQ